MKNKKGFTLIELLITLAIMALLTVVIVPLITNMRDDMINKSYESKKNNIYSAAKNWAYDNLNMINTNGQCTYVIIDDLIKKSYIAGDSKDKTVITDPRTGEAMNELMVCVTASYKTVTDKNGNTKTVIVYNTELKDENE
ncbi:MAG: type II secretion system protein [Bacilli bacterium]|nr:type II secretion system protein [Bacilli bacterium]